MQNMRDLCNNISKELIKTGDTEFGIEQVKTIIEFIKPKRQNTTVVLQSLVDFQYLKVKDDLGQLFSLGDRRG
jgi:hypothetical protein